MDPVPNKLSSLQLEKSPDFKENSDPAEKLVVEKRLSFGTDEIRAVQTTEDEFTVIRQM